jgi:hypothetical protein
MESRIQILNRLAHKWSRNNPDCIAVDTFDEWLLYYDSEATIKLVYIAMQDYAKPIKNNVDLDFVSKPLDPELAKLMDEHCKEQGTKEPIKKRF